MRCNRFFVFSAVLFLAAAASTVHAVPYASNVSLTGTTVNFLLNEPADSLTYSINGGAAVALDGTTKGAKTFMLGAGTDSFEIFAEKDAAVGWSIPTGDILPAEKSIVVGEPANGLGQPTAESGLSIISDDSSLLTRFNSPRGVDVSHNPNSPNFGTVYIANSAGGTQASSGRILGDGMYALRADGSDAFAYGDTAQNPPNVYDSIPVFITTNANSPYRVMVADSGQVYVSDWSDANGNVYEVNPTMTEGRQILDGFGGSSTNIGDGRNHGSIAAAYVTGSRATNDLVVWTIDEDLNTGQLVGGQAATPTNDRNSLWRYDVGAGAAPHAADPVSRTDTGLFGNIPGGGVTVNFDFGPDGKIYAAQFRSVLPSDQPGIFVRDSAGVELWNSLTATRTLLADPTADDVFRSVFGVDVSPDGNWLAVMVNSSDVAILPLVNGIPDIANRLLVNSAAPINENTGRDISFDAAGNIHYVSSGQGRYRVLAPGGHTLSTLSWDGTEYEFEVETIVPPTGVLGDFNEDDKVDAADYIIWRKNETANNPLPNDDGSATQAERFDLWKANFGEMAMPGGGSGQGGAVPEPGTFALVLLGAMLAGVRCRRRV